MPRSQYSCATGRERGFERDIMSKRIIKVWVTKENRPFCRSFERVCVFAEEPTSYGIVENPQGIQWADDKPYANYSVIPKNKARRLGIKRGECKEARLIIEI